MLFRLIKKEEFKMELVPGWSDQMFSRHTKRHDFFLHKSFQKCQRSLGFSEASNPALSGWVFGRIASPAQGHLSAKSHLSGECSSYRATCHMVWIHMFHYGPGEALTQLQVSGLNYDTLPALCARDMCEQIYCPVTRLLLHV